MPDDPSPNESVLAGLSDPRQPPIGDPPLDPDREDDEDDDDDDDEDLLPNLG